MGPQNGSRGRGPNEIFKISAKRGPESSNKRFAEGPHCVAAWRKLCRDRYRCEEGPYWAGRWKLCSQLCLHTPGRATSPLLLCLIVASTERWFYTKMIAQQRLCAATKKAPRPVLAKAHVCALPPFCPSPASLTLSSPFFPSLSISNKLRDDRVMNPYPVVLSQLLR